jgi:hypothetical protein
LHKSGCLDDSNSGGYIESVTIGSQANIRLLETIRTDKCVNLSGLNAVGLLDGGTNFRLIGANVDDENNGVVVLNHLHCTFSGQRVLDDLMVIELRLPVQGLARVHRLATKLKRVRAGKGNASSNLEGTTRTNQAMEAVRNSIFEGRYINTREHSLFAGPAPSFAPPPLSIAKRKSVACLQMPA